MHKCQLCVIAIQQCNISCKRWDIEHYHIICTLSTGCWQKYGCLADAQFFNRKRMINCILKMKTFSSNCMIFHFLICWCLLCESMRVIGWVMPVTSMAPHCYEKGLSPYICSSLDKVHVLCPTSFYNPYRKGIMISENF